MERTIESLACTPLQDVVERFHLFCALAFVMVEDMNNSGTWRPSRDLACQCAYFLGAEVIIGACTVPHSKHPSQSPHNWSNSCRDADLFKL